MSRYVAPNNLGRASFLFKLMSGMHPRNFRPPRKKQHFDNGDNNVVVKLNPPDVLNFMGVWLPRTWWEVIAQIWFYWWLVIAQIWFYLVISGRASLSAYVSISIILLWSISSTKKSPVRTRLDGGFFLKIFFLSCCGTNVLIQFSVLDSNMSNKMGNLEMKAVWNQCIYHDSRLVNIATRCVLNHKH